MGFIIQTGEKKVKWPVRVHEPIDGGKTKEHEFEVTYGLLTQAEYDKAMQDKLPDHEFIKKILRGWSALTDEGGNEIPFNDANIELLASIPYIRRALISAYHEAVSGIAVKN